MPDRVRASDDRARARGRPAARAAAAAGVGRSFLSWRLGIRSCTARRVRRAGAPEPSASWPFCWTTCPARRPPSARRTSHRVCPAASAFNARWRAPVRAGQAADDLLEYVAPPLRASGYKMVEQTPDRLVFERDVRPYGPSRSVGLSRSLLRSSPTTSRGAETVVDRPGPSAAARQAGVRELAPLTIPHAGGNQAVKSSRRAAIHARQLVGATNRHSTTSSGSGLGSPATSVTSRWSSSFSTRSAISAR